MKLKGLHFNINVIQVYAPTAQSEDEEIERLYDDLDNARRQCKSQEVVIMMVIMFGDLNGKVGEGRDENIVGSFELGERNEHGERFVSWCKAHNQIVMNTWFKHHNRRTRGTVREIESGIRLII